MNKTFFGTASITNSKRTEVINLNCSPGPAGYDPHLDDQQRIPLWSLKPKIEHGGCFHNTNMTPGIGKYNITNSLNISEKNPDKESRVHKDKIYIDKTTHMSDLNLPSSIQNNKGFKFGFREEEKVRERSPGPIYNVDSAIDELRNNKKENSNILGLGKRDQISEDAKQFPGPGSYCPEKYNNKGTEWGFSKSSKKQKSKHANPLGPGDYNPKLMGTNRGCKLKGRYPEEKREVYNTGPGAYQIPDTKSKVGTKFSNNHKNSGIFNKSEAPSPFSYTPAQNTFSKGGCSLGKKLSNENKNQVQPGPGSYELRNEAIDTGPGGYMGRKREQKKGEKDDNFYKYNPKFDTVAHDSAKYTFTKNELVENEAKINRLGPGSYNVAKKGNSSSYTIPKDQRFKPLVKEKNINTKVNENAYATVGFLPDYLKKKEKKGGKNEKQNKENIQ